MFEKYGEFDSVEELNKKAAELKDNLDELKALAEENGLDPMDAEDYADGAMDELATPLMAATGKINAESKDLKLSGVLLDWSQELIKKCTESEELARAVRKKGKSLAGYIALTADTGFEKRAVVDKKITALCKGEIKKIIGSHEFSIGIPDKATRSKLIIQYYIGK